MWGGGRGGCCGTGPRDVGPSVVSQRAGEHQCSHRGKGHFVFSVTVTPWRVEESAPHPVVVIVVGPPPAGWELQAGESRLAGRDAICPLVGYLIILVSVKPGQTRSTRCVGV